MIRSESLRKTFDDGYVAVRDATFRVPAGTVLGMLGANGAGKTTTIHMLLGFVPPTSGKAWLGGVCVQDEPLEAKKHVGYVSENVLLYGPLTAEQNLRFFARVCGRDVPPARVGECLARVGLASAAKRRVEAFSKGMRQRLGIAVALVKDPEAFVMDEPTTGLDPVGVRDLHEVILSLRAEGKAILLVTHDLHRLHEISDGIVVMRDGELGPAEKARSPQDVERLYHAALATGGGAHA